MKSKRTHLKKYLLLVLAAILWTSCAKIEGEGGSSSIRGKVFGHYYNNSFTAYFGSQFVPDEDVYIIYGEDFTFSDRIRTSYDGSFEFKYLQKGNYKIFVYSKDSTLTYPSQKIAVLQNVEISKNNEIIELEHFIINK